MKPTRTASPIALVLVSAVLLPRRAEAGAAEDRLRSALREDPCKRLAEAVVRSTGINAGLCVHLNCTDGTLTSELAKHGKFVVHGLATTPENTDRARQYLQSRALHGTVSIACGSLSRLPYVENLVNLVVVEDLQAALTNGLSLREVMRVLCPNGVVYLRQPGPLRADDLIARLATPNVNGFEIVRHDGSSAVVRKKRPAEMDEWTHWLHGPECNSLSSDSLVGPASRLRWIDGPYWPVSATRAAVFSGGRGFTVVQKGRASRKPPWTLVARDAYNGLLLWQRDLGPFQEAYDPRLLVAGAGRVFVVMKDGGPLVALDAASGDIVRTYDVGIPPRAVLHHDDHLILGAEAALCSVNAETGSVRWKKTVPKDAGLRYESAVTYGRYPHLVCGNGRLFAFIKDAPAPPFSLVCYDADTGAELWRVRHPGEILKCYEGVLALLDQPGKFSWTKKILGTIRGVSTEDGRTLWEHGNVTLPHADASVFCSGGLFWINRDKGGLVGIDSATGDEKKLLKRGITGHCGFIRTTDRYFIGVYDTLTDRQTGRQLGGSWAFKNTCFLGNVPANGLLYNLSVFCGCMPYLRGFLAFAPARAGKPEGVEANAAARLNRGPAYGLRLDRVAEVEQSGWSTYRHDPVRSGATSEALPRELRLLWSESVNVQESTPHGKTITPPVVAQGVAVVAAPDAHQVCALNAETGELRWRYLLDGRVEVPPTMFKGLCLFGANDGWAYCLRATDGKLVWRFRAAPEERRIMVSGRLESPWPVPGVLVENGVAYFAAGRHSGMDRGIWVYAVEPFTGKLLWQKRVSREVAMTIKRKKSGWNDTVHANDLLVSNGKFIVMGRLMFDSKSGDLSMDWRDERFLSSGSARSGRGLVPFGFLDDRRDAAERLPKNYTSVRYHLTLWSYAGAEGLLLAFTPDKVLGVTGEKERSSQYYTGVEWELFARRPVGPAAKGKAPWLWSVKVPRGAVRAVLPAGPTLFVAGPEDKPDSGGGMLRSYSLDDGKKLGELRFGDAPVFDGLAAAGGRLYVSTEKGRVYCFGAK